jgi:signal transduction histidine kinase
VRRISHNLRPYQLDRLGLTKALQAAVKRVSDSGGLRIEHHIANLDGLFSSENEIHLYRVVQESLNNILKHSQAASAWIAIERAEGQVQIRIEDDGCGFDYRDRMSAPNHPGGFGLTGIRERVRLLGGQFTCDSAPGQGTRLRFDIPISQNAKPNHHSSG